MAEEGGAPGGGGIKGTLTKKWGPLPVWVYGVTGAVVLFLLMRGRSSGGGGGGSLAVGSPAGVGATDSAGATGSSDSGLAAAFASFADAIRNQAPPVVNVYGTPAAVSGPQSSASAGHGAPAVAVVSRYDQLTYASPGPTQGYNIPKGAPLQNVTSGTTTTPISLSDWAVRNKAVLPGTAVPA